MSLAGAWVKVKLTQAQEFVIGGYTLPEGSRKYFGALLVGYYSPAGLLFAGRVGTGFSERVLAHLYEGMQEIKRETCPFVNLPEKSPGRWRQGITPAVMKRCAWVEPVLVAQVRFTEWTSDGQLRQPVFLGLRTAKDPKECRSRIATTRNELRTRRYPQDRPGWSGSRRWDTFATLGVSKVHLVLASIDSPS